MSVSESKDNNSSGSTTEIGKRYIETSYKYLKLKTFHLLTTNLAMIVKMFAIGSLISSGVIFLSISGAIALGNHFESMSIGYLLIASIFIFLGLIMYFIRGFISRIIIKKMSYIFFEDEKKIELGNPKLTVNKTKK